MLGKRPINDGEVASPPYPTQSIPSYQVPIHPSEFDRSNYQLGYRSGDLNLASRNNMLKKVKMPSCDGENISDWLVDIEHFFTIGHFRDEERLDLIPLCIDGRVNKWFAWVLRREGFRNWLDFRQKLLLRFSESIEDEPSTKLFKIKQTGSVADYVSEFEVLSAQVPGLEDRLLERIFYKRLSNEMKEVIRMKDPQGLPNFIAVILKMEKSAFCQVVSQVGEVENASGQSKHREVTRNNISHNTGRTWDRQKMDGGSNKENVQPQQQTYQRLRLKYSDAELDAMRRDKICFKCKAPWSLTHICPNKELRILTVINGLEMEVLNADDNEVEEADQGVVKVLTTLSLNSFLGIDSPKTTKLWGRNNGVEVVVMLDSGASHNFLSP